MKKRSKFKMTGVATVFVGVGASFGILIILTLLGAALISSLADPLSSIKTASLVLFLISGAVSGFVVAKFKSEGGILLSALSSLIFSLMLIAVSLICNKGSVGGGILMNALCYFLIAALFAFFGRKRERRSRRR